MSKGAIYVSDSKNEKISGSKKVDATYCSIKNTCPSTCSLRDEGCYGKNSYAGMINARLDRRAKQSSPLQIARSEARVIDHSYGGDSVPTGRALRLHVVGDTKVIKGARSINAAIARWKKRGGGDVWSYTHAWSHVSRKEWSNVSILASIENVNQVAEVRKQGYAPALVVQEHHTDKAYSIPGSDVKWLPCPAQTKDNVSCVSCRLCMRSDWLFATNRGITFAAHGTNKSSLKKHLTVLQG